MKLEYIIQPDNICQYYRKLSINNIDWRIFYNVAYIYCNIEYGTLINDEFVASNLKMYPYYSIVLTIDNTTLVNPLTGGQSSDGENEEDCTLGEYDFFVSSLNKVPLETLLELGINRTIARGRHNV